MNKRDKEKAIQILREWATEEQYSGSDKELAEKFQIVHDLDVDGIIGSMTFGRLLTWKNSNAYLEYEHELLGEKFVIDYSFREKCHKLKDRVKPLERIVTHWDAALNANSCVNVLLKRGVSTHFVIDNDGTIIQLLPVDKIAYHAKGNNDNSIGIDISNAYYVKYADWYKKNVGLERPIIKSKVHHSTTTHLGYYPLQLESYHRLCLHLASKYDIPIQVPVDKSGNLITTTFSNSKNFKGIMCHYHLTTDKIDCQGLELDKIFLTELEKNKGDK